MSEPERMADLVEGHPREFLGRVLLEFGPRRRYGTDDDVAAVLPAAERDSAERGAAEVWDEVHHHVGDLLVVPSGSSDIGQRDGAVEALEQHVSPDLDGIVDRIELSLGGAGMGLDGDRQVGVVPPVPLVVRTQQLKALSVRFGQRARRL